MSKYVDPKRKKLTRLFQGIATEEEMDKAFGLDPESRRREQRKQELESDYYEFVKEAFAVLEPAEQFRDNWHIQYLCGVLQEAVERLLRGEPKLHDIILNVPPRSLKSILCTVCLLPWAWTRKPSLKLIGSSYAAALSTSHCVASRRLVQSEWYRSYWGDTVMTASDQDEKTKFETTQQGLRMATSTGGQVTGGGADIVVIDDPVNPQQANSEAERTTANTFFRETLSTRLNNPETGLFIVVMQRLHEQDLTGYLLENEPDRWFHVCLPVELTKDVNPPELAEYYLDGYLFPQRFGEKVLSGFRTRLGSFGYAGQMLQRPAPAEGGILKGHWFRKMTMSEFEALVNINAPKPGGIKTCVFADTAYKEKQHGGDPSALLAAVFMQNNLYILSIAQVWLELPALLSYVKEFMEKNGFPNNTPIRIEPKASGVSVVQSLRGQGFNAIELPSPKDDKVARAHGAAPFLEAGRCFLVLGPWVEGFLSECQSFPNGAHDDQVDVLTAAVAFFTAKPTVQRTHGSMRI